LVVTALLRVQVDAACTIEYPARRNVTVAHYAACLRAVSEVAGIAL